MAETSICSTSNSDYDSGDEERIVLHVYDDESKEFTSLTTYHGMIRIYTSETWPSRIFWGVVVVTCVTLFMIQGGVLLEFYNSHPTATKIDEFTLPQSYLPSISICPYGFRTDDDLFYFITENDLTLDIPTRLSHNSSESLLIKNSFSCEEVIDSITIGLDETVDFCSNSRTQVTDIGTCFTLENWKNYPATTMKVKLKNSFRKTYTAHIHSAYHEVSRLTTQVWLKPGIHAKLSFNMEEQNYLRQNDWGTCKVQNGETYNHIGCLKQCYVEAYRNSCGCNPFFDKSRRTHCTIEELQMCSKLSKQKCDCPVQCYSRHYILQPVYSLRSTKKCVSIIVASMHHGFYSQSTVTFHLNSKLLKSHHQYKRFKQIDLMSYIGGVMGLFLGMSCITLLEVFIYLFKTIFGTLNNTRHKEFVERLLSDDDDSIHGSHEEIIITQKIDKQGPKLNNEQPDGGVQELVVDAGPQRRFSMIPSMNSQLGMKVQFHRPNHTLKRNSVYLGNCDF
ncbi:CRE-TAG-324 protein [Caenorhabditis remanei]|uniref:CRE-TAG-324 protein n=1 Tax=Caenorhabditis remanei TaxID=31234 RepID=E3MC64_CAERE|nr:CRE-TAG-324 protein [Caenorhabditis remanei]